MPHLKAMHNIVSKDPPLVKGNSEAFTNFISSCLQKKPKDRASSRQLLEHPFLKKEGNGR